MEPVRTHLNGLPQRFQAVLMGATKTAFSGNCTISPSATISGTQKSNSSSTISTAQSNASETPARRATSSGLETCQMHRDHRTSAQRTHSFISFRLLQTNKPFRPTPPPSPTCALAAHEAAVVRQTENILWHQTERPQHSPLRYSQARKAQQIKELFEHTSLEQQYCHAVGMRSCAPPA